MATGFSQTLVRHLGFEAGIVEATSAAASFPKHTHDEFVISANIDGAERIWLDGRTLEAEPGDVTAYNPGALQASHGVTRAGTRWRFVSLYAEPGFVAQALGLQAPPSLGIPVLRDTSLMRHFTDLARIIAVPDGVDAGMAEETAVAILAATVGKAQSGRAVSHRDAAVRRVATILLDRVGDPPCLAEIAADVGMSREHLIRRFASVHGMPPMAWALQRRVARARTLLRGGMLPAEVAATLGFADQAHLTRAFRHAMGTTPGRYRAGA